MQGGGQRFHLVECIVECKRCAHGAREPQPGEQRLCAVVPGSHGHPHLVEQRAHVERVDAIDDKAHHGLTRVFGHGFALFDTV